MPLLNITSKARYDRSILLGNMYFNIQLFSFFGNGNAVNNPVPDCKVRYEKLFIKLQNQDAKQ